MRDDLVGRRAELARLDELWAAGERLITLLGPGGAGKTRLAHEAVRGLPDGHVVVCALDGVDALDELLARLADALGLTTGGAGPGALERVGRALARGAPLVVLDGFERLVGVAAGAVRRWLQLAPELRCLVTSRRALGLDEEVRVEVPPLAADEGVRLLLATARRVRPEWAPGEADLDAVRAIVRRLDGLPLAIKLCAGRAAVLSPGEMLTRLARRFELLAGGRVDVVSRHRSLQAALDGSWELLGDGERRALARLAVLDAGFTMDAAEAVLPPGAPALDLVQVLREHSLVRALPPAAGEALRFALDDSVRDYAAERLAELGERGDAETGAARHVQALTARLAAARGPARRAAREALAGARERLLPAIERLLAIEPAGGLDLLVELHALLCAQERRDRHLDLLAAAVSWARQAGDAPRLARALATRAEVLQFRGRLQEAERHAEEAGALAVAAVDDAALVDALRVRGEAARAQGDVGRAVGWLEEALARARQTGDRRREGQTLMALASLRYVERRFELVERAAAEARAVWIEEDEPALEAQAQAARGVVWLELDRLAEAEAVLAEALAGYRSAHHRQGEGRVCGVLAEVAWARGRDDEAVTLLRRAIELHQAQDVHPWTEMELAVLALVEAGRGRAEEALAWARQAERCMGHGEYVRMRVFVQGALAVAAAAAGALAVAEPALAVARAAAAGLEPVIARHVELCAGLVDVARAREALAHGQALAADEALAAARRRLAALADDAEAPAARSHDLRAVARLLAAALAAVARSAGEPAPAARVAGDGPPGDTRVEPGVAPRAAFRVAADGRWFSPPGGGRVAVERRAWGRLVVALVRHRLARPGEGLSTDDLFTAGWPDERALQHAARNRVWVALSGLRALGLEPFLLRRRGRYLLDAGVAVVVEPPVAPEAP